jgi:hypothetical protein
VLVTRPPGYVLRVPREQIDLGRFERLVADARSADPAERARRLRSALELWRGPPLADMTYEPFAQVEIRRLEELRLDAIEDRIEAELEAGHDDGLVSQLEALVAQQPLRERLRGQLMLALYRSGRQAEALQTYLDFRSSLDDELGIEPGRELQQLYGRVLRQERALSPSAPAPEPEDAVSGVVKAILAARLVPVLGPAVCLAGRPEDAVWRHSDSGFAPGEDEVAAHLAAAFGYPLESVSALARVSQYVAVTQGVGPLYDELHLLYDRDYEPGPVPRFLASLPPILRERGLPHQLIVTTGYDETLERAFAEAGEDVDVVSYLAVGRNRGKFLHTAPDGSTRVVHEPNADVELSLERRTVILNVHGRVDRRPTREWESFVVCEDDYIDYLPYADVASVVPVTLAARLRRSHFLFLGYALQQWNLRVFLRRVWTEERIGYRSWAVGGEPDMLEREYWRQRNVDIFTLPLADYVDEVRARLAAQ